MTRLKEYKVTVTYPYGSKPTKQVVVPGINPRDAEEIAENMYGGKARATSELRGKKMKTYEEFTGEINEAIAAARLAQLAAKGKGAAAAAKMSADGLKAAPAAASAAKNTMKALPGTASKGGALGGGALAKVTPKAKPAGGALARTNNSGAIVRQTNSGPGREAVERRPAAKPGGGYMTSPDGTGKPRPAPEDKPKNNKKGKKRRVNRGGPGGTEMGVAAGTDMNLAKTKGGYN